MPPAGAGTAGPSEDARGASDGYHHAAPGARAGRLHNPHNPLAGWSRRLRHILGDDWAPAYLFMAPLLVLLVGLIAWPILQAIWMSFHNVIGPRWGDFVGLRNYLTQLEDPLFRRTLFLTVLFTAEAVVIKFAIGLAAALALHQLRGWRFAGSSPPSSWLPSSSPRWSPRPSGASSTTPPSGASMPPCGPSTTSPGA